VSAESARGTINRLKQIVNSGRATEIQNIGREGKLLCDPDNGDGTLAVQFRFDIWPQV